MLLCQINNPKRKRKRVIGISSFSANRAGVIPCLFHFPALSSTSSTSLLAGMPRASASENSVLKVGNLRERSIIEMWVGSRSLNSASFSWVIPLLIRKSRMTPPKYICTSRFMITYRRICLHIPQTNVLIFAAC